MLESVPLLSDKIVTFALQHKTQVHDVFLMMQFGTSLADAGEQDHALSVFSGLLRSEPERQVQQAILKRCLDHCWKRPLTADSAVHASAGGGRSFADKAMHPSGASSAEVWAKHVAQFAVQQQSIAVHDMIAMLHELGVPVAALQQLCTQLLAADTLSVDARFALLPELLSIQSRAPDESVPGSAQSQPTHHTQLQQGRSQSNHQTEQSQQCAARWVAVAATVLSVLAPARLSRMLLAAPVGWLLLHRRGQDR